MRQVIFGLVLAVSSLSAVAISDRDVQSRQAALQWLALVDAGQYRAAYQQLVPRVRAGGTADQWNLWLRSRRGSLGRARTRAFIRVAHTRTMGSAPDGDYIVIYFKTSYERKVAGAESVTLSSETGHWQVSGYHIY
jgi:hypothetical protein